MHAGHEKPIEKRGLTLAPYNIINPPIEIGQEFYRWTVLEPADPDKKGRKRWLCQCKCGTLRILCQYNLYNGGTKSCGCLKKENSIKRFTTHGNTKGGKQTAEYHIWVGIKGRVLNPNNQAYKDYGGRGITIEEEWINSFEAFFAYVGPRPSPQHTIDRILNDSGYVQGNIKWSTKKEQARNRRSSRLITYKDETLTAAEWSERTGIKYATIIWRVKNVCDPDKWFVSSDPSNRFKESPY